MIIIVSKRRRYKLY